MTQLSTKRVINCWLCVDNMDVKTGIGYDIIIDQDIMVQLGLIDYFKHNILKWHGSAVPMKQSNCQELVPWKPNINKLDIREVVIKTAEP